jgi:hypothetical protein
MSINFKDFFTYSKEFFLSDDFEIFQNDLDMKIRFYNKEKLKELLNKVNKIKNGKDIFDSIINKKIQSLSFYTINNKEFKEKVRMAINEFMIMKISNCSKILENE